MQVSGKPDISAAVSCRSQFPPWTPREQTEKASRTDPRFKKTFEKNYLWVFLLSFLILFKTQWPKTTEAEEFGSLTFPHYSPLFSEVMAGT